MLVVTMCLIVLATAVMVVAADVRGRMMMIMTMFVNDNKDNTESNNDVDNDPD